MRFYQPDLTKPETKFNNCKISFDKDFREMIAKIVEKVADIKIDLVPRENTEHLDVLEFKKHEITKDLEAAREDLKQINKELEERNIIKQLINFEKKKPFKIGNIVVINANNYQQMQTIIGQLQMGNKQLKEEKKKIKK